jgi:hypothetical protein
MKGCRVRAEATSSYVEKREEVVNSGTLCYQITHILP